MYNVEENIKSVPVIILLTIFTCGIYYWYWIYDTTRRLNIYNDEEVLNPALVIVLSIVTCGLYNIYWWYKIGEIFVESQYIANANSITDNKILLLILDIFGLSIISMAIMQSDLNRFWATEA